MLILLGSHALSHPEIEEVIELKLNALGKVCKNEASQAGQLLMPKTEPDKVTKSLVYIYDPDYVAASGLAKHLSIVGFDVHTYQYLADMGVAVRANVPDIIVADIDFQNQGGRAQGFERLQQIREYRSIAIPLIVTAQNENMNARTVAVKMGADGFMLKPISMSALVCKIFDLADEKNLLDNLGINRVLLVDQDPESAKTYKKGLSKAGFEVQWLADYNKAIFAARDSLPDLIILNIAKRNVNPVQMVRLLRHEKLTEDCKIIVLAAEHQQKFYVDLAKEGINDFISYPLQVSDLAGLVEARLRPYRRDLAERIFDSRFDLDTQLYSLPYFEHQVRRKLKESQGRAYFALLHVGIDQAKQILEKFGDSRFRVLRQQIAQLIVQHLEPDDISARFSDSGFIVLYKPERLRELDLYCQALCSKISDYSLDTIDSGYHVTVSVGVCQIENEAFELAMDNAITASKMALRAGGNRVEWNSELKEKDERQQASRKELRFLQEAIDEQRLFLLFQPIASLAIEDLERYDVLLRLLDVEGNEVEPFEYVNAAREHDMSRYIDRWVVHAAIKELSGHTERGSYPRLFLKLSIDTANDVKFIPWLELLLSKYEVRSEQCIFGLEEQDVIRHSQAVKPFFSKLHILGCRLEISNFGNMPQGLDLLKSFKLDYLKLSPSLFEDIDHDYEKQNRLTYICSVAAQHQIKMLASCIEDPRQLVALCRFGIDLFQGYMIQEPSKLMDYEFSTEM
ncbi:MAG: EAL domain-containing protein [Pseudomonadales bacterium]|nr:EAL domain-containing protein [Pseudomonadales bacterium]